MTDPELQTDLYYVSDQIRSLHKKAGKSQEELADDLRIGVRSLHRLENGSSSISIDQMMRLCQICGSPVNVLFPPKYLSEGITPASELHHTLNDYKTLSPSGRELASRLMKAIVSELMNYEKSA